MLKRGGEGEREKEKERERRKTRKKPFQRGKLKNQHSSFFSPISPCLPPARALPVARALFCHPLATADEHRPRPPREGTGALASQLFAWGHQKLVRRLVRSETPKKKRKKRNFLLANISLAPAARAMEKTSPSWVQGGVYVTLDCLNAAWRREKHGVARSFRPKNRGAERQPRRPVAYGQHSGESCPDCDSVLSLFLPSSKLKRMYTTHRVALWGGRDDARSGWKGAEWAASGKSSLADAAAFFFFVAFLFFLSFSFAFPSGVSCERSPALFPLLSRSPDRPSDLESTNKSNRTGDKRNNSKSKGRRRWKSGTLRVGIRISSRRPSRSPKTRAASKPAAPALPRVLPLLLPPLLPLLLTASPLRPPSRPLLRRLRRRSLLLRRARGLRPPAAPSCSPEEEEVRRLLLLLLLRGPKTKTPTG